MLPRSGLIGKKSSWPHLGPSQAIFSMDRKNPKKCPKFAYFPWQPFENKYKLAIQSDNSIKLHQHAYSSGSLVADRPRLIEGHAT